MSTLYWPRRGLPAAHTVERRLGLARVIGAILSRVVRHAVASDPYTSRPASGVWRWDSHRAFPGWAHDQRSSGMVFALARCFASRPRSVAFDWTGCRRSLEQ